MNSKNINPTLIQITQDRKNKINRNKTWREVKKNITKYKHKCNTICFYTPENNKAFKGMRTIYKNIDFKTRTFTQEK